MQEVPHLRGIKILVWGWYVLTVLLTLTVLTVVLGAAHRLPLAHYRIGVGGALLPDPRYTPGEGALVSTATVCKAGYAKRVRNVTRKVEEDVYTLYGAKPKAGVCCEVDHLVSLELGGTNNPVNLWPQPYEPRPGAHEKDIVEDFLHRAVCSGHMSLQEAQHKIATNWAAAYAEMKGASPR